MYFPLGNSKIIPSGRQTWLAGQSTSNRSMIFTIKSIHLALEFPPLPEGNMISTSTQQSGRPLWLQGCCSHLRRSQSQMEPLPGLADPLNPEWWHTMISIHGLNLVEKPFFWNLIHFSVPPVPSTNLPEGCQHWSSIGHLEKAELKGTLLVAVRSSFRRAKWLFLHPGPATVEEPPWCSLAVTVSQAQVQHLEAFLSELRSDPDCQSCFFPVWKEAQFEFLKSMWKYNQASYGKTVPTKVQFSNTLLEGN